MKEKQRVSNPLLGGFSSQSFSASLREQRNCEGIRGHSGDAQRDITKRDTSKELQEQP